VLLIEPEPTSFDLHFRLFGVHVRVHPFFWLCSAFLGWDYLKQGEGGLQLFLIWMVCVFVSILLHELGHVFAGRLFGARGHIVLYSFGGLAIGSSELQNRWQRVFVYFAGPLIQFLLFGVVFALLVLKRNEELAVPPVLARTLVILAAINLFWPILNLLPIWPLDGGRISYEVFDWLMPSKGIRVALGISLVLAGLLAAHSLAAEFGQRLIPYVPVGGWIAALLFALLALRSFQQLQMETYRRPWDRERDPWES